MVAEFLPASAMGRIRPGQTARLRLEGFPWAQYGRLAGTVSSVGSEIRGGRVRVELAVRPNPASPIPLQHGLPGAVEVEVERLAPVSLVLRAAGRLVAGPGSALSSQAPRTEP
jgi:membrane fusion protein (multidrug efflux system)